MCQIHDFYHRYLGLRTPFSLMTSTLRSHWPHRKYYPQHPLFLTTMLQKGKEITEIQHPEDTSLSLRSQVDGHSFSQRNTEVRTCPALGASDVPTRQSKRDMVPG